MAAPGPLSADYIDTIPANRAYSAANDTSTVSAKVLGAAGDLLEQSQVLHRVVGGFINRIRAA